MAFGRKELLRQENLCLHVGTWCMVHGPDILRICNAARACMFDFNSCLIS